MRKTWRELGYKVGDKFRCVDDPVGSTRTLKGEEELGWQVPMIPYTDITVRPTPIFKHKRYKT